MSLSPELPAGVDATASAAGDVAPAGAFGFWCAWLYWVFWAAAAAGCALLLPPLLATWRRFTARAED